MASVRLDFVPPDSPDITKLHIFEAPTKDGIFSQIEEVTSIGSYPNYISYYTTTVAANVSDWFAIQWEDSFGALSDISEPIQGGTTTLVNDIIRRVMLRDPLANEIIAQQEAEAVIENVFGVTDAYSVDQTIVTAKQKSGITFLTLARTYLSSIITSISSGTVQSYTAGLVSQSAGAGSQSSVTQGLGNIQQLIDWANADLGLNVSVIMLLKEIDVAGSTWMTSEWTLEALGQ
jgi:hypothetical protein